MKKVYIAGPMRGIPYYNFPAFDMVVAHLWSPCIKCISPADLDREVGFDALDLPADTDWDRIPEGFDFDACMKRDTDAVMEADGIFILGGWEKSRGAVAEVALARWRGIPVFSGVPLACVPSALPAWETVFGEEAPTAVWSEFCWSALVEADVFDNRILDSCRCKCTGDTPEGVYDADAENVGLVDNWNDAPATITESSVMKDTNPKDTIGSRKAKLSVIPGNVLYDLGLAMTEGMVKYGRHNYRVCGVRSSVYYDAAMGHLLDWWEGQDVDPDSGLNHVTKSIASLVVLRDAMMQGMLKDDRPPSAKQHKHDFNDTARSIMDRHADKNPKHYTIGDKPNDIAQG